MCVCVCVCVHMCARVCTLYIYSYYTKKKSSKIEAFGKLRSEDEWMVQHVSKDFTASAFRDKLNHKSCKTFSLSYKLIA